MTTVIQADGAGVVESDLSSVGGALTFLRPPAGAEPSRTVAFARGEVGAHYGFLTIGSIAVDILTPSWLHVPVMRPGTWICSAFAAEALRFGGWYHRWPDIYQVTPAELLHGMLATGSTEVTVDALMPGDIGFAHGSGLVAWAIRLGQRVASEQDSQVNHAFVIGATGG
ncbi:MAG TPA: hypothetical protein VF288_10550 [Mycobacteriales bacterium]